MNAQKVEKWRRQARVICDEVVDLRERVRDERMFWFALNRHPELDPSGSYLLTHFYKSTK